jgi:Fe-coproporphyrin III synthase
MIDELKKALSVRKHPGMSRATSLPKLAMQAMPFVTSPRGEAKVPMTIYWSVNSVCNLRCKMCDVGNANPDSNFFANLRIDGKLHEIVIDRFRAVIDEVAHHKPMISITSTEPLMYRPLGEAVSYARGKGLDVAVTTGGYTLPKRAEELAEAGLNFLSVSIDGPPDLHNKIRGRVDSFQKSVEGIRLFREALAKRGKSAEILINYTVSNMNFDTLVEAYDALKDVPVDRINFTYMNYVDAEMADTHNALWGDHYKATVNCLNDDTDPKKVDVDVLYAQIQAVKAKDKGIGRVSWLPDFTLEELKKYFYNSMEFMGHSRCMVSWFIAQIIASGEVIPYTRCYNVPFGNINDDAFMDIWNGDKARDWRRTLRAEKRFPACTRCDLVY